ncbi:hypothetical protein BT69DRAFT_1341314 [Atractiella rhizophila]|nr:hypothetical protein BT69DRAFT_1341314 [Atractiella rhizophila]
MSDIQISKAEQTSFSDEKHGIDIEQADVIATCRTLQSLPAGTITSKDELNEAVQGVTRISLLYQVFKDRGNAIWLLYISIGLLATAYALSSNTALIFLQFATSGLGHHAFYGTIQVVVGIAQSVCQPFVAKIADVGTRPVALTLTIVLFAIGFAVVAASQTVQQIAGGQVIYAVGSGGLFLLQGILIADITSLKWRALANGLSSVPYILFPFISGYITEGIGLSNWRWAYGMFAIMVPAVTIPAIIILFWGDYKAKRLLPPKSKQAALYVPALRFRFVDLAWHYYNEIDGFGLILTGFSWTLLLLPFTLSATADHGWANASLIAMFVVGGVLQVGFFYWEIKVATRPLITKDILNKNFLIACQAEVVAFCVTSLADTYYLSWIYVIKDWSTKNYTYFSVRTEFHPWSSLTYDVQNISTVGLSFFGLVAGTVLRVHKRFKYFNFAGLALQIIAKGFQLYAMGENATDVALVWSRVLSSFSAGIHVVCNTVGTPLSPQLTDSANVQSAAQGSVPHRTLASAQAIYSLYSFLGGSIGNAIATAVWT